MRTILGLVLCTSLLAYWKSCVDVYLLTTAATPCYTSSISYSIKSAFLKSAIVVKQYTQQW